MKRIMMTIVAAWMMITSMNAQRLTNIQAEARFITDKMVVELGLSKAKCKYRGDNSVAMESPT